MRKNFFLCILLVLFLLPWSSLALPVASAAAPADWAWLVQQVAAGKSPITLPNDITRDSDDGLAAGEMTRIEGNGFTLTDVLIDKGTLVFKDVKLSGIHGIKDEAGSHALTLRGDGAVAVLMGVTRAEGGRSGPDGETGGDGVLMEGKEQGLILNNASMAVGGIGRLFGGAGIHVTGSGSNVLITDNASAVGSPGLAQGGAGLWAQSCTKITLSLQGSATGGMSPYAAGHGIHSAPCEACEAASVLTLSDMAMAIGGAGQDGGSGLLLERASRRAADADLRISDACMVFGGDGGTAGSAIRAANAAIEATGAPSAFAGRYYETESPALALTDCAVTGDITEMAGTKTDTFPASSAPTIINTAISQQSDRYTPDTIEDGLTTRDDLLTKMDGLAVESGSVSQAKVNGGGLKILMYNGTLEKRMQFKQRLMSDGAEGVRLVLIGSPSDMWPTVDITVGTLDKLETLGITQLAYTCVAPVYHERVLDLATLAKAAKASKQPVDHILCGTADDAIIFHFEDKTMEYQEELMQELVRPID